jgi:hypothetical protein
MNALPFEYSIRARDLDAQKDPEKKSYLLEQRDNELEDHLGKVSSDGTFGGDIDVTGDVVIDPGASNEVILGSWPNTASYQGLSGNLGYILLGHPSSDTCFVRGETGKELRIGANNTDAIIIDTSNFTTFPEPITVTHYSNTVPEFRTSADTSSGFGSYAGIGPCMFHSNGWRTLWYSDYVRHNRPVRNINGSASTPSTTFNDDPNTGAYRNGADSYGIATAGAEAMVVQQNVFRAPAIYSQTTGSSSTARIVGSAGQLARSSSSLKLKRDVERFDSERAFNFVDAANVIRYRSNLAIDADWGIIGMGAEPTAEIDELFVQWSIDECVCGLSERRRLTHLATETANELGYDAGFDDWNEFEWEHPNECLKPQSINEMAIVYATLMAASDLRKRVAVLESDAVKRDDQIAALTARLDRMGA